MASKKCLVGKGKWEGEKETNVLMESQREALDKFLKSNMNPSSNPDRVGVSSMAGMGSFSMLV
jgi:hypothetical protein